MLNNQSKWPVRFILLLILLLYGLLSIGFGALNPLFEAPDEQLHFFTVRYVANTGKLPTVTEADSFASQEAGQPPLYYLLGALLISPIDTTGLEEQLWPNPTAKAGDSKPININIFIHGESEKWPWHSYALAAHILRLFSAIAGLGTLLCIYGSGRLLWPHKPEIALLATALVAFLPQFVFLHGSISNDSLIIFLSSLLLWELLRIWQDKMTSARLLLLGITIGLAILAKMTGLLLLVLACGVLLLLAWRDSRRAEEAGGSDWSGWPQRLWQIALFMLLPALLLSGWLLVRNWILYGDVTAVNQFVETHGGNRHFTLRQVWHDLNRVVLSSVATFGWMNVRAPAWIYSIWLGIVLSAALGLMWQLWWTIKRGGREAFSNITKSNSALAAVWLAFWVLLLFASWLQFMIQTPADQGRLLFPALLPIALLLAFGLSRWRQRWLLWIVAILALLTSAYSLLVLIPDAYALQPLTLEAAVPASANRIEADMGHGLELVALEVETGVVHPGDWLWVTLYWRADQTVAEALFETLKVYDRNYDQVGLQKNYHGGGNYPTNLWTPGEIIVERMGAKLSEEVALPTQLILSLEVGEDQNPVEIARLKAVPSAWPKMSPTVAAQVGEGLELAAAEFSPHNATAGTDVTVTLRWQVREAPGRDLTTFVHLGDRSQAPLAQADSPPFGGGYPTHHWSVGEVLDDSYTFIVPEDLVPGRYPIQIGMYEPDSGMRLPLLVGEERQAQDAYLVGWLTVE